jgi:hypothetical protein
MLRDTLASQDGIDLECCNEDEHIPKIERYIRTVKDRTRCSIADVPFRFWPRQLVIQLVGAAVYWLNVFPPKDGVHQTLGPSSHHWRTAGTQTLSPSFWAICTHS